MKRTAGRSATIRRQCGRIGLSRRGYRGRVGRASSRVITCANCNGSPHAVVSSEGKSCVRTYSNGAAGTGLIGLLSQASGGLMTITFGGIRARRVGQIHGHSYVLVMCCAGRLSLLLRGYCFPWIRSRTWEAVRSLWPTLVRRKERIPISSAREAGVQSVVLPLLDEHVGRMSPNDEVDTVDWSV